jgi:hypothetical protein
MKFEEEFERRGVTAQAVLKIPESRPASFEAGVSWRFKDGSNDHLCSCE